MTSPGRAGRLSGKVAIVMGGGSSGPGWGNGKAATALYAREGARVTVVDSNLPAAEETCELIRNEGGSCLSIRADIRSIDDVRAIVDSTIGEWGCIDILHNNVGVTDMTDLSAVSEDQWRNVLDINLTGAFLACKLVLPHMIESKHGVITNISSIASVQINSYPYFSYYASKAALNHLTRALAVHYAPQGIRANAILPGVMDTPLIHNQISGQYGSRDEMIRARNAASPIGFMGNAWDVAYAALFLASDEARYITGVCLPVDGGKSCVGK